MLSGQTAEFSCWKGLGPHLVVHRAHSGVSPGRAQAPYSARNQTGLSTCQACIPPEAPGCPGGGQRGSGGAPVCCGPGQGSARCRSCLSARSEAWRVAAPAVECPSSAGVCVLLPLCCQTHAGGGQSHSPTPCSLHPSFPPQPHKHLGEAEPCRSVLLDFRGVFTFSGTTRLVLRSPNMS